MRGSKGDMCLRSVETGPTSHPVSHLQMRFLLTLSIGNSALSTALCCVCACLKKKKNEGFLYKVFLGSWQVFHEFKMCLAKTIQTYRIAACQASIQWRALRLLKLQFLTMAHGPFTHSSPARPSSPALLALLKLTDLSSPHTCQVLPSLGLRSCCPPFSSTALHGWLLSSLHAQPNVICS